MTLRIRGNKTFLSLRDDIITWTQQGKLYIRSENPVGINLYSVTGIMIQRVDLKAGETTVLPLDRGIYVVVPDPGRSQKVMVW